MFQEFCIIFILTITHCFAQNVITIPSAGVVYRRGDVTTRQLPIVTTINSEVHGVPKQYTFNRVLPIEATENNNIIAIPNTNLNFRGVAVNEHYTPVELNQNVLLDNLFLERAGQLGLTTGLTGGIPLGSKTQELGPIIAAIITQRTAEVVDFPTPAEVITPQVLIVEPNQLPVTIEFRSQSSPVNVHQVHIPGPPGDVKATRSEEEPDRVLHEVVKPVIQEVREIIQPLRKITQEILPVQEEVHSVIAKGEGFRQKILEPAIPPPTGPAPGGIITARVLERGDDRGDKKEEAAPTLVALPTEERLNRELLREVPRSASAIPLASRTVRNRRSVYFV